MLHLNVILILKEGKWSSFELWSEINNTINDAMKTIIHYNSL